jgi:predicted nucleotidyltransferase
MDKKEAIRTAQEYIYSVRGKYALTRALLFGSFAKGTNHTHSDIDVAVVVKDIDNLFDMQVNLMHLRNDNNLLIEPHPFREKDFDANDPFVYEILSSGVELRV